MQARVQLVVGLVMELTLVALVVGLIALGGRSIGRGFTIFVDFDRVENLKEGAEVRISSMVVGRIIAIRQGRTRGEPETRARVRTQLWLDRANAHFVRRNSVVFINSKGPIGERYLEVGPSVVDPGPAVAAGEVLRGIDSTMMDRLIQRGYDLLRFTRAWQRDVSPDFRALVDAMASVRSRLDAVQAESRMARIRSSTGEAIHAAGQLWREVREGTDELRQPNRLMKKLDDIGEKEGAKLAGTGARMQQLEVQLEFLDDLLNPETRARLERSAAKLQEAAKQGEQALLLLQRVRARVDSGRGTVGRMLADEELADEIKETHRILKEAPWRALGREPQNRMPRGAAPKKKPQP